MSRLNSASGENRAPSPILTALACCETIYLCSHIAPSFMWQQYTLYSSTTLDLIISHMQTKYIILFYSIYFFLHSLLYLPTLPSVSSYTPFCIFLYSLLYLPRLPSVSSYTPFCIFLYSLLYLPTLPYVSSLTLVNTLSREDCFCPRIHFNTRE